MTIKNRLEKLERLLSGAGEFALPTFAGMEEFEEQKARALCGMCLSVAEYFSIVDPADATGLRLGFKELLGKPDEETEAMVRLTQRLLALPDSEREALLRPQEPEIADPDDDEENRE